MKQFNDVLKIVRRYKKFLVVSHSGPDADAAASSLAMSLALKKMGKATVVLNEDALPEWLNFLPKAQTFKKSSDAKSFDYDAVIILDCGDLERIGAVKKLLRPGCPVVNIDHHVTNTRFGAVNCVMPKASSTCEVLFDLFEEAKITLNKEMALLLYAGIMTDTGSFRFESTSAHTHTIAGKLVGFGFKVADLYKRLYPGIPVVDIKLFSQVIQKADLLMDSQVYCVAVPKKTSQRFSKGFDLKEKLFTFLRNVQGIEVVIILNEINSGLARVNLRSQGKVDVAKLAQQFKGGGHQKAAGCKIYSHLATAQKSILSACAKHIKLL